jgi:hypothetical protein
MTGPAQRGAGTENIFLALWRPWMQRRRRSRCRCRLGKARAWAVVADTLDELRAMLPAGLTRWERTSVMSSKVVQVWD